MTERPEIWAINEHHIQQFRQQQLSPRVLLDLVEEKVWALIRLGIGVGKSTAADQLLSNSSVYDRFDLVVYAAPLRRAIQPKNLHYQTTYRFRSEITQERSLEDIENGRFDNTSGRQ